jgi:hypothetical protein
VALLTQGRDGKDFARVKRDVKEMYAWRSDLMHGSASPFDRRVLAAAKVVTALVRWCMFTAFAFFEMLLNNGKNSDDDLELAYEGGKPTTRSPPPANSKLKPTRPGFGPALKRLGRTPASRCHGGCRSCVAVQQYARQPPRHYSRSRVALAAQLSLKHVRRTNALHVAARFP